MGCPQHRVTKYALLGRTLLLFSGEELEILEYAGIFHDIGKIGVTNSILTKPGSLSPTEWIMCQHPLVGANTLADVPFLAKAIPLILHHHESYDGNGYPDGLKGEDIPIDARLLSVADAFDTMTPYRITLNAEYAIKELHRCSGTQFCPVAVEAFVSGFEKYGETAGLEQDINDHNKQYQVLGD